MILGYINISVGLCIDSETGGRLMVQSPVFVAKCMGLVLINISNYHHVTILIFIYQPLALILLGTYPQKALGNYFEPESNQML